LTQLHGAQDIAVVDVRARNESLGAVKSRNADQWDRFGKNSVVQAGINLVDTGDFYGKGRNELLIGEALKTLERETLLISVKFGAIRSPNGQWLGLDMRPKSVKNYLYYSGIEQDILPTTRERGIGITGHMECFRELEPGTGRSASRSGHGPTSNGGTDRNSPGCGTGDRRDSTGRRAAWRLKGSAQ